MSTRPTLSVQSRSHPIRYRWRRQAALLLRTAAVLVLGIGTGHLWRQRDRVPGIQRPAALQELETRAGQQARVRLSDGTRIVLGPAGRLRYPADFGRQEREVVLEGEAFFEVAPDPDRPFTVRAGSSLTRVLGTEFSLRAFPGDRAVEVVVAGGRVAFGGADTGVRTILTPGSMATLEADGTLSPPRAADLSRAFAWTEGRLVFQNAPLADVARALERRYAVLITFADPGLAAMPVTADFRTESAAEAIRLLALSLGLDSTRTDRGYRLHFDLRH